MEDKIKQFFKLAFLLSIISCYMVLYLFSHNAHSTDSDIDTDALEAMEEQSREKFETRRSDVPEEKQETEDDLWHLEGKSFEKENQRDQSNENLEESPPATMESLDAQSKEKMAQEQLLREVKKKFERTELMLDLPPDTVLATLNADPMVYVDEFNQRVATTRGEDLFDARYKALVKIVDIKLMSALARQKGFENDPLVRKARQKATETVQEMKASGQFTGEISDEQVRRYYKSHIDRFRRPDRGTRVRFVAKGGINDALTVQKRIENGEPFSSFCFLPDPIPGSWLPRQVQEAIFPLEPGQMTDVIKTPVGIFIVQLVARNNFDNFKVSVIIKNSLDECQQILRNIKAGREFESLVANKGQLAVDYSDLPDAVQQVIVEMELNDISQPVATPLGYFLVKLMDRWSDAEIISAKLIRLNSEAEGLKLLARLESGSGLGQIDERQIAGTDLPIELQEAAKRLAENEYSAPVKTAFGYYLVKVEKRRRQKYFPFELVAEEIKNRIKARTIKEEAAYQYYQSNLSDYRKPRPEYILDLIFSDNQNQAEAIVAGLQRFKEKGKDQAAFEKYQQDLNLQVSADILPIACQKIAATLQPGQISPVIETHFGYFILRLAKVVNPAFVDFENVRDEIKLLLVRKGGKQDGKKTEHQAKIAFTSIEEQALERAFLKTHMKNTDSVSDEEAEQWWQANKTGFFKAFRVDEQKFKFPNPKMAMRFKKNNVLLQRYRNITKDLYAENNVVIFDHLLVN